MTSDVLAIRDQLRDAIKRRQGGYMRTAELTGINRCSLHRAFRRRSAPSLQTIALVAHSFGMCLSLTRGDPG